jgi:hypothetical protein
MGSDQNPIEKRAFRREIAERIVPAFRATWVAEPIFGRSLEWSEAQSRLGEITRLRQRRVASRHCRFVGLGWQTIQVNYERQPPQAGRKNPNKCC